jgi:hypothetical protein
MQLIDPTHTIDKDFEVITRKQEVTDEFLKQCADNRFASSHVPMGDMHLAASIPVSLVDHWKRQGFDIFNEPAHAILARLRKENFDAFITTNKNI